MSQVVIILVRIFVILIALGTLAAQIFVIPELANDIGMLSGTPAVTVFYAAGGILLGACLEVCLVATWVLLSMVSRDAIFTGRAFRWVDAIIIAALIALVLVMVFGAHAVFALQPRLDAPGLVPVIAAALIVVAAFALLVVVLRGLLRTATNFHDELSEVI